MTQQTPPVGRAGNRKRTEAWPRPNTLALHRGDRGGRRRCDRWPGGARRRVLARDPRHAVREPDQDDDQPDHLLHDRARHRIGPQRCVGGQSRRVGDGLLPHHVDRGPGDRAAGRQRDQPRNGTQHLRRFRRGRRSWPSRRMARAGRWNSSRTSSPPRCCPRSPRATCCRPCSLRCWSGSGFRRWARPGCRSCAASG